MYYNLDHHKPLNTQIASFFSNINHIIYKQINKLLNKTLNPSWNKIDRQTDRQTDQQTDRDNVNQFFNLRLSETRNSLQVSKSVFTLVRSCWNCSCSTNQGGNSLSPLSLAFSNLLWMSFNLWISSWSRWSLVWNSNSK